MPARLIAASIVAAVAFATSADAADLYGENYRGPRDPAPYDDPRYADDDRGQPPPGAYAERDPRYGDYDEDRDERYSGRDYGEDDWQYRGSTKDGYPLPVPPPRFAERDDYRSYGGGCLPRWQIRHRLRAEGWVDVQPLERWGELAKVKARRHDTGRVFTLRVDRCSGEIVDARPHHLRAFGAYEAPPWRHRVPY
jgi:hypothetical protein